MLRLPDALETQVQSLLTRAAAGAPVVLPALQGLRAGAAARVAYQLWVDRGRATGPLVQPGASVDSEALELARGGWLSVEAEQIPAELAQKALDADVQILADSGADSGADDSGAPTASDKGGAASCSGDDAAERQPPPNLDRPI